MYFNTPRDSEHYKTIVKKLFDLDSNIERTVRGFAALEAALMDGIYANHDDNPEISYLVSTIIADAIFSVHNDIDAVMLPSKQQRHGINIAFRETIADKLEIAHTCVNQAQSIYITVEYKYRTYYECLYFEKLDLKYTSVAEPGSIWNHYYR